MFSHRGRVWQYWEPERAQTGAYPWNSAAKCAKVVVAKTVGRHLYRAIVMSKATTINPASVMLATRANMLCIWWTAKLWSSRCLKCMRGRMGTSWEREHFPAHIRHPSGENCCDVRHVAN